MWGVRGHMHRVIESSYGWVQLGWWRHRTEHGKVILLLIQQHHISPHFPFLLLNTLNKEFLTTDYCVTLYKDISIASPWGPWVMSQYWHWKTWIWSQSSSRAIVVEPRLSACSLLLICSQLIAGCFGWISFVFRVFYYPWKQIHTKISKICSHLILSCSFGL